MGKTKVGEGMDRCACRTLRRLPEKKTLDEMSTTVYRQRTIKVIESGAFKRWIRDLRDRAAVARINARLRNASLDNFGDVRAIAAGISEMRVHHGPGHRLYFLRDGDTVVLLCRDDKDSRQRDIERAGRVAKDWRETCLRHSRSGAPRSI